mmetsp:Transcript_22577/g.51236  ORF Transcript_22577/g.51236 Transcript_22577/m.51236 type:complete len:247 (+) Transcript_22577:1177-1917(+)
MVPRCVRNVGSMPSSAFGEICFCLISERPKGKSRTSSTGTLEEECPPSSSGLLSDIPPDERLKLLLNRSDPPSWARPTGIGSFFPPLTYLDVALSCSSCATLSPVMMMSTSIARSSLSDLRVAELGWTIFSADRKAATRHDARASSTREAPTDRFLRRLPNSATRARSYRSELSRKPDPRVILAPPSSLLSSSSSAKLSSSSAASTALKPTRLAHKCGRLLAKKIRSVPRLTSSPVRLLSELRVSF